MKVRANQIRLARLNFFIWKELDVFAKLPLTALRAFESAARLGGFKSAAKELFVTPAAISHQVKLLESQLGVLLFERSAQGVKLTESGEVLYPSIHLALSDMNRSFKIFTNDVSPGKIRVTTTPAFAALWLIPRISAFYENFPDVQVSVETSNDIVDLLRDSSVDLAIRCGNSEYPDLYKKFLMYEEFGVFSCPMWEAGAGKGRSENLSLINVRWGTPFPLSISWENWCRAANREDWLDNAIYREYDDEHFALQAAISGQGLVLASTVLVADSVSKGLLVPVRPDTRIEGLRYSAVAVPGRERISPLKEFLDWLEDESKPFQGVDPAS